MSKNRLPHVLSSRIVILTSILIAFAVIADSADLGSGLGFGHFAPVQTVAAQKASAGTTTPPTLGIYPNTTVTLSANVTITPDAPPTNTASINVSTDSNFKGRIEADPLTGMVRVTNAHPSGTYLVTVRGFDAEGASTTKTFSLSVTTPPTCNPVSFPAAANFSTADYPRIAALGDFNGDGKQDIVTANEKSLSMSVLLGDGAGGFSSVTTSLGGIPVSVAVDDFNGDGKQDLVFVREGHASILLGDGAGGFGPVSDFGTFHNPLSVAVGDFNGDGRRDLVIVNNFDFGNSAGNIWVLLGDGTGSFSAATSFAVGWNPAAVAIGDFNRDSIQDLVVANYGSANASILLGNGLGGFSNAANFGAGLSPFSVAVGDFNDDGMQDIAVTSEVWNDITIRLGDGAGGFSDPTYFSTGLNPISVAVGDFNGDKKQDLAVANRDSNNLSLLLGDGVGSFSAPIDFAVGNNPMSIVVGDFDGNGKQDLAAVNAGSASVSILLRNCAQTFSISGTVTYGNATGSPEPRFVSNVLISSAGSSNVSTTTAPAGPTEGQYTLNGFGTGSYTVTPSKTTGQNSVTSFDAAKVAQHVAGVSPLTGNQLVVADTSGNGTLSSFDAGQIARYAVSSPPFGAAGNWLFSPANRTYSSVNANITGQDYEALLMGEVSGNWTNSGARPAKANGPERAVTVTAPNRIIQTNREILIPIKVQSAANKGIIAYEFELRYDSSVIHPQGTAVDLAGTVSRGLTAVTNVAEPGLLRVAVYGPMPINENGVLLSLRFVPFGASGSVSPLVWERFIFNEGEPQVSLFDGHVVLNGSATDQ